MKNVGRILGERKGDKLTLWFSLKPIAKKVVQKVSVV